MTNSNTIQEELLVNTCLLAGEILIASGSEVKRTVNTINHIAKNAHYPQLTSYVTLTGIMVALNSGMGARLTSIDKRSFNLEKIAWVNEYSHQFAQGKISLQQFYDLLTKLNSYTPTFPVWLKAIAAGAVSGAAEYLFRNNVQVVAITIMLGILGWLLYYFLCKTVRIEIVNEFVVAFVLGLLGVMCLHLHLGNSSDDIIIGSLMPLLPGVQITTAVRDLMAGDLVSGVARGIEACINACALGFGVVLALKLIS